MSTAPLVLFDGPCTLCQRSVRFVLRHEQKPLLTFASLQSETGRAMCEKHGIAGNGDSMILIEGDQVLTGSDAALALCRYLRPPWNWAHGLRHLPGWMHQPVYRWIARHRYKWFGRDESCPLPDPEQAERFLDEA